MIVALLVVPELLRDKWELNNTERGAGQTERGGCASEV